MIPDHGKNLVFVWNSIVDNQSLPTRRSTQLRYSRSDVGLSNCGVIENRLVKLLKIPLRSMWCRFDLGRWAKWKQYKTHYRQFDNNTWRERERERESMCCPFFYIPSILKSLMHLSILHETCVIALNQRWHKQK